MNTPATQLPSTPTSSSPQAVVEPSLLPGFKVLLQGPTGVGKTHSIGTLVDAGVDTFYIGMESGMESLLGYWTDKGKPIPPNLHWHNLAAADSSFGAMLKTAESINQMTNEGLAKIQDPNKHQYNQFIKFLKLLAEFEDQRTGNKFGAVDKWGPDHALVIDALTGINLAAMSLVVGGKPIKSLVDWGIAMDQVEKLIRQLAEGCKCIFVLLAHIERETDQVLGGQKITVGTLGTKLASKIPPMFSDVILASRQGSTFAWSTANPQADLKARNLPIADNINPDFKTILAKWQSRGGRLSPTVQGAVIK